MRPVCETHFFVKTKYRDEIWISRVALKQLIEAQSSK